MKIQWSSIDGHPIALSSNRKTSGLAKPSKPLGTMSAAFMHPETGQIIAYLVGYTRVLSPVDIEKWSKTTIQVRTPEALVQPEEILRLEQYGLRRTLLNGKKVRTKKGDFSNNGSKSGHSMGCVQDFTIDTLTNSILSIHTAKSFLGITWHHRTFSYKLIHEVTKKAIILSAEPEVPVKSKTAAPIPA
jgi:hypothetical protein